MTTLLPNFSLAALLSQLGENAAAEGLKKRGDIFCAGASQDTRTLRPGELFVALSGDQFRGIEFIAAAAAAGAVAALAEEEPEETPVIPVLLVSSLRDRLGDIAEMAYKTKASGMRLFAVTGTNGKTSTTTYIFRLLRHLGVATGMSASHLQVSGDDYRYSALTTPECLELHRSLFEMRVAGATAAAVEVSAHALDRHRVDGLQFEVAGFTNLARDHLDDFGTMENYRSAKARLFTSEHCRYGVVNVTNEHGSWILEHAGVPCESIAPEGDWRLDLSENLFTLRHKSGMTLSRAGSFSRVMAENLAVATVMLHRAGFQARELEESLQKVDLQVPGRLERFDLPRNSIAVFLDYAHTPAAVEAAVATLEGFPEISVIIGASGNRDQGKRPEMGFAAAYGTRVIVTDQHPRREDPALIREAVKRGALLRLPAASVFEAADPQQALELAISLTKPGGAILWCGPGDLDYREVGDAKIAFSARKLIESRLSVD